MARIDPEAERRRLADFYAHQLDGELEKVAAQAYELTEIAREALTAEISRRGLSVTLVEHSPMPPTPAAIPGDPPPEPPAIESQEDDEFEFQKMVTIRQFRDLPEALFAKGSLESAGIENFLTDLNITRLEWPLTRGIRLQVAPDDVESADSVLKESALPAED